jgi:hypothetical protein
MRAFWALTVAGLLTLAGCGSTTTVKTVVVTTSTVPATTTPATTTPATTTPTTTTTAPATEPVFFQGVVGGGAQRPSSLQLTGDGTLAVEHVQWTSWGGSSAAGSGSAFYHGCTPNCAEAQTHTAVVSIQLSDIRSCGGRHYYAGLTLTLPSGQLLDRNFVQRSWSPC